MKQKGFTIIELIISIFILSVGIVGVYSAFSIIVILTADASDRLTAAYLAQEGEEIIRNIRDSNWISPDANIEWDNGLSDCEGGLSCRADYKTMGSGSNPVLPWSHSDADYLKRDTEGFYSYETGLNTKFKRKITIEKLDDYILKVVVQVSWDEKPNLISPGYQAGECIESQSNCIQAEDTLYNWY